MVAKSPESAPKLEEEINETEILPFQEQENEAVKSLTEKYAEATKISDGSIKVIDGFLAGRTEAELENFALRWFSLNENRMKEEGRVIPPGASDEWKISMALGSREKGGMAAMAEINNPEYEATREDMDRIGVLRTNMRKEHIPPETPFLLLNYLQRSIDYEKEEIHRLKMRAEQGDQNAGVIADSKEKQLKELYLARKELAEKTMKENLTEKARESVGVGMIPKEDLVGRELDAKKKEIEEQKNEELMNKEWQEFMRLPEKQRSKYQKKLGERLELSRDDFDKHVRDENHTTEQAEEHFQQRNRDRFREGVLELAGKKGIEGQDFYGLLNEGYKPYEAKIKRPRFLVGAKKLIIPNRDRDEKSFIKAAINKNSGPVKLTNNPYLKEIEAQAVKELEDRWDKYYEENVNNEIQRRITELAESPEKAEGGIREMYKNAREKIVAEYVRKRVEKNSKTKEQLAVIEKKFKEQGKKKDINDFMSAVLFEKWPLSGLGDELDKSGKQRIAEFLQDWGIKVTPGTARSILKSEYRQARKTRTGLFYLLMGVIEKSLNPAPSKKKKAKSK